MILKVSNLTKKVANGKIILDNVTFNLDKGERIAVVGGNGAGKTTLVETVLGIQQKSSGSVEYGIQFDNSPLEKVGVQFQDANFPEGLSARQILDFFVNKSKYADKDFSEELLSKFVMHHFMDTDASKLSGGQAQKLNVTLALINRPELIFLDELTTGLDVFSKNKLTSIVEEYIKTKNVSMILVTHTPHEIERLATRMIVMSNGKITLDASVTDVVNRYGSVSALLDTLTK